MGIEFVFMMISLRLWLYVTGSYYPLFLWAVIFVGLELCLLMELHGLADS